MAYFPLFVDLEDKNILVVGGGKVAERKISILLQFSRNITVVAKKIKSEKIKRFSIDRKINLKERLFQLSDLDNTDLVIVAVDDISLQKKIYDECMKRKIPVNSVDSIDYCSFIFPAIIKEEDLVIGISSSGKAPALAGRLKDIIKDCLPKNLKLVLKEVAKLRESLPKGLERQKILKDYIKNRLGE